MEEYANWERKWAAGMATPAIIAQTLSRYVAAWSIAKSPAVRVQLKTSVAALINRLKEVIEE